MRNKNMQKDVLLRGLFVLPLRYSTNVPLHKTPLMLALCAREMTINESQIKITSNQDSSIKEFKYSDPKVKIGQGKFCPVMLIIYKNDLFALKRIPKSSIDKVKRIENLKNEKKNLLALRKENKTEP